MSIKVIGLTGGIGSGKSTVARIFLAMGFQVYFADDRSKALLNGNEAVKRQIAQLLGEEAYHADGTANRSLIGLKVFQDKQLLSSMNAILHPAVQEDRLQWLAHLEQEGYAKPFAITEAAILFESGAARHMQGVIAVTAPEALRIQRVMERDHVNADQVRARMAHQLPEAERLSRADFVIHNDGSQTLIPQVLRAIQHFS